MEDSKCCSRCKEKKEFSAFNKSKSGTYGLHNHCKECQKQVKRDWYLKNKEHCINYNKKPEIKEAFSKRMKIKYHSDLIWREQQLKKNRERRRLLPAKLKQRENEKKRRITNPSYRIGQNLRSRLRKSLIQQGVNNKSSKTLELIGCSPSFLKVYIESLWKEGMSWDNYGKNGWHIDHILPCASFNLELIEEQKKCFHFSNLQPLWAIENIKKSNKIHA